MEVEPDDTAAVTWVVFRRDFRLNSTVQSAKIRLFAVTRYRLRVNGNPVAYGPARWNKGTQAYDTHQIDDFVQDGENTITVEVCLIQYNNFQNRNYDKLLFCAFGELRQHSEDAVDLSTPGEWVWSKTSAWMDDVPPFSFAIGPVEMLRTAVLAEFWSPNRRQVHCNWQRAVPSARDVEPLLPRPIPYASGQVYELSPLFCAPFTPEEYRFGYTAIHPTCRSPHMESPRGYWSRYFAWIYSPRSQSVSLGVSHGTHTVNGTVLESNDDPDRGNRKYVVAKLKSGWNLIAGEIELVQPRMPVVIALPRRAGLIMRARCDKNDRFSLQYAPACALSPKDRWVDNPPNGNDGLIDSSVEWKKVRVNSVLPCPAIEVSWDRINAVASMYSCSMPVTLLTKGRQWTIVFDQTISRLGHVILEVDAPQGTVFDIAYDERRRNDGTLGLYSTNPWTDTADRFICGGGVERIETFHPRGGRYIQVTIRPPLNSDREIRVMRAAIRDARCLPAFDGWIETGDALFDWISAVGKRTVACGTEDSFCDAPWRERGTYLGDSYVHSLTWQSISDDCSVPRRALQLFSVAQHQNGQLPCVTPSWYDKPHGDFTLVYVLWLHDYWSRTGDIDLVMASIPVVDRILRGSGWQTSTHSVLWDALPENRLFIDWGCRKGARTWEENGVLNAFRYQALCCAATMHSILGNEEKKKEYDTEATLVRSAFRKRLWLSKEGCFSGGTESGVAITKSMIHANVLALAFGLADPTQEAMLVDYVYNRVAENPARALEGIPGNDFLELYFMKYVLDACIRLDRHDVAEAVIRKHMSILYDLGATTFWECIHRGIHGTGSLCHAWSTGPLDYLMRFGLGIREEFAGEPDRLIVDPRIPTLACAQGIYAHPRGPVKVKWEREGGELRVRACVPDGVRLDVPRKPPRTVNLSMMDTLNLD